MLMMLLIFILLISPCFFAMMAFSLRYMLLPMLI